MRARDSVRAPSRPEPNSHCIFAIEDGTASVVRGGETVGTFGPAT
jgi:hypothetical protein